MILSMRTTPTNSAPVPGFQVRASSADLLLAAGSAVLDACNVTATAHTLAQDLARMGCLLALPVADISALHVDVKATWLLANGRSADDHHIFPREVRGGVIACPVRKRFTGIL